MKPQILVIKWLLTLHIFVISYFYHLTPLGYYYSDKSIFMSNSDVNHTLMFSLVRALELSQLRYQVCYNVHSSPPT